MRTMAAAIKHQRANSFAAGGPAAEPPGAHPSAWGRICARRIDTGRCLRDLRAVSLTLLVTLLRQAARNVRHGGFPFVFATVMLTLSLFALGVTATVLENFSRVTDGIGRSVGAVAFLDVDNARSAELVRARLAAADFVTEATLVPPQVALARARSALGEGGNLFEGAAGVRMPWVVELGVELERAEDAKRRLPELKALEGVDEVMHPGGELSRVEALGRILYISGIFLAFLIALVVIVVVGNTVQLTLFARREEILIMKLVGATDAFVRVPFILEGLVQGLLSASLALLALLVGHTAVAKFLESTFSSALVSFSLHPLPPPYAISILVAGAVLGAAGAGLSLGRYLKG